VASSSMAGSLVPRRVCGPMAGLMIAIDAGKEPDISGKDNLKTIALCEAVLRGLTSIGSPCPGWVNLGVSRNSRRFNPPSCEFQFSAVTMTLPFLTLANKVRESCQKPSPKEHARRNPYTSPSRVTRKLVEAAEVKAAVEEDGTSQILTSSGQTSP